MSTGDNQKYIFGVKIYLDVEKTQDTNLGLYTNGGESWFRWIQTGSIITDDDWKSGMLLKNGIGIISEAADFRRGGNLTQIKGTKVSIKNVIDTSSEFWKELQDIDLSLSGLYAEIIEFDATTSAATETIIYRGICEAPKSWSETTYTIPIKNAYYKRVANLGTLIDNDSVNGNYPDADANQVGEIVPVSFGDIAKAKAVRVANKENVFNNSDHEGEGVELDPNDITTFPIISDQSLPTLVYDFKIGSSVVSGTVQASWFENKFILVVEGTGKGQYRQINQANVLNEEVDISIYNYFDGVLQGNITATKANQSWIQIVDINVNYAMDVWKCRSFLRERNELTSGNIVAWLDGKGYAEVNVSIEDYTFEQKNSVEVSGSAEVVNVDELPPDFRRIPSMAIDYIDDDKFNKLDSNIDMFNSSINKISSFLILPAKNIALMDEPNLHNYGYVDPYFFYKMENGFYQATNPAGTGGVFTHLGGTVSNITDQDYSTYYEVSVTAGPTYAVYFVLRFELPDYPSQFDYDTIYVGIKEEITQTAANGFFFLDVHHKKWIGTGTVDLTNSAVSNLNDNSIIDCLPDWYYTSNIPSTENKNFYTQIDNVESGTTTYLTSYPLFELNEIDTKEAYNSVGTFMLKTGYSDDSTRTQEIKMTEISIIFKRDQNVKEKVFAPFRGRRFESTWGDRKRKIFGDTTTRVDIVAAGDTIKYTYDGTGTNPQFSTKGMSVNDTVVVNGDGWHVDNNGTFTVIDVATSYFEVSGTGSTEADKVFGNADAVYTRDGMIESPIDILEHVCRLQNWSETGDEQNWGKEYSPNALIDTSSSTEGGFDYSELDSIKEVDCSRQISSYDKAQSDNIKKSLCQQFNLCNYQNVDGEESIINITKNKTSPDVSLTMSDIIRGSISFVNDISPSDIFCEPFVRYNKNYATGGFNNIIRVTNSNAAAFDPSYVTGFSGSEAEQVWEMCHALWLQYRVITEPPSTKTDATWINQEKDAKNYLLSWLDWMGVFRIEGDEIKVIPKRRISFSVPYEIGTTIDTHKAWHIGMHLDLQLPHETDNVTIQCVIEKIAFDVNKGTVKVQVVTFPSDELLSLNIENSFDSYSSVGWADWENSYLTKAEAPSQEYDIEKIT